MTREEKLENALKTAMAMLRTRGHTDMDCDGDGTFFGYCAECGRVEYRGHEPNCLFEKVLRVGREALDSK